MLTPYTPLPRFQGTVTFCRLSLFAGCHFLQVVTFCRLSLFEKEYNHLCKGHQLGKVLIFEVGPIVHSDLVGLATPSKRPEAFMLISMPGMLRFCPEHPLA
jgi:hypothetical protein